MFIMESLAEVKIELLRCKQIVLALNKQNILDNSPEFKAAVWDVIQAAASFLTSYETSMDKLIAQSSGQQAVYLLQAKANLHKAWFFSAVDFPRKKDVELLVNAVIHLDLAEDYLKQAKASEAVLFKKAA